MRRGVLQKDHPLLRQPCSDVVDFEKTRPVIEDLIDTIRYLKTTYSFSRGIGLAAPQIGELVRVSVAEYGGKQYVLVNPKIIEKSAEKEPTREGCISFFEYRALVPRYKHVKVEAQDQNGERYSAEADGDFAMLLQHEIDHLDGILYVDRLPNKEADLMKSSALSFPN